MRGMTWAPAQLSISQHRPRSYRGCPTAASWRTDRRPRGLSGRACARARLRLGPGRHQHGAFHGRPAASLESVRGAKKMTSRPRIARRTFGSQPHARDRTANATRAPPRRRPPRRRCRPPDEWRPRVTWGAKAVRCWRNSLSFGYSESTQMSHSSGVGVAKTRRAISIPARCAATTSPVTNPASPSEELGIALTMKSTAAIRAASSDSSRASVTASPYAPRKRRTAVIGLRRPDARDPRHEQLGATGETGRCMRNDRADQDAQIALEELVN